MFNNSIEKQILKKIKEYNSIFIARHVGPDPDAIASECALRDIIKLTYPKKNVFAIGTGVAKFKYIGYMDKIDGIGAETKKKSLLIILDVPKFERVDGALKDEFDYTIKIDHHPCDVDECDINYINESSSSTCQMVAEFAINNKLKMNEYIAETLFTGIVSDSERFLLSYTSPKTFDVASYLLDNYNVKLEKVYDGLYDRPINERRFEAYIINNINITDNGFGYIKITKEDEKKYEVDANTASNMVNNLNHIKELKCWAFSSYDEKNKQFRINIRSRKLVINDIAMKYNGGGHKFASGARIENEEDVDKLFKELDDRCK